MSQREDVFIEEQIFRPAPLDVSNTVLQVVFEPLPRNDNVINVDEAVVPMNPYDLSISGKLLHKLKGITLNEKRPSPVVNTVLGQSV